VALPQDLTAEDALKLLRRTPEHALYNLYVVDRDHHLVGVLNLRELLLAGPKETLSAIMRPALYKVPADADRYSVVSNPGWKEVHSLPVVDQAGHFLGALRYRTFKHLEDELRGEETEPGAPTVAALGDLFRAGIAGLVDAMASAAPATKTRKE
jgi:magnesium transporter